MQSCLQKLEQRRWYFLALGLEQPLLFGGFSQSDGCVAMPPRLPAPSLGLDGASQWDCGSASASASASTGPGPRARLGLVLGLGLDWAWSSGATGRDWAWSSASTGPRPRARPRLGLVLGSDGPRLFSDSLRLALNTAICCSSCSRPSPHRKASAATRSLSRQLRRATANKWKTCGRPPRHTISKPRRLNYEHNLTTDKDMCTHAKTTRRHKAYRQSRHVHTGAR